MLVRGKFGAATGDPQTSANVRAGKKSGIPSGSRAPFLFFSLPPRPTSDTMSELSHLPRRTPVRSPFMNPGPAAWKARRLWPVPLLLLAGAAVPTGAEPPGPEQFPDVPRQATACAVLRFGDFYRSPAGQAVLKTLSESAPKFVPDLEKTFGIP